MAVPAKSDLTTNVDTIAGFLELFLGKFLEMFRAYFQTQNNVLVWWDKATFWGQGIYFGGMRLIFEMSV